MNQPTTRVDPLGRSAALTKNTPIGSRGIGEPSGSAWPIAGGSRRAIVDTSTRRCSSLRDCAPAVSSKFMLGALRLRVNGGDAAARV